MPRAGRNSSSTTLVPVSVPVTGFPASGADGSLPSSDRSRSPRASRRDAASGPGRSTTSRAWRTRFRWTPSWCGAFRASSVRSATWCLSASLAISAMACSTSTAASSLSPSSAWATPGGSSGARAAAAHAAGVLTATRASTPGPREFSRGPIALHGLRGGDATLTSTCRVWDRPRGFSITDPPSPQVGSPPWMGRGARSLATGQGRRPARLSYGRAGLRRLHEAASEWQMVTGFAWGRRGGRLPAFTRCPFFPSTVPPPRRTREVRIPSCGHALTCRSPAPPG